MQIIRPTSLQPIPPQATCVFQGKIFAVYQWEQKLFDGSTAIFEKVKRLDTVSIIAVTPDKKIVISEQNQPGSAPFVGLVGGIVDSGEDVFAAAVRELLEEAGYQSNDWGLWDAVQPISKIDWAIYTFVARNCQPVTKPHLDAGEQIEIKTITFDQLLEVIQKPEYRDHEIATRLMRAQLTPGGIEQIKQEFFG